VKEEGSLTGDQTENAGSHAVWGFWGKGEDLTKNMDKKGGL